MSSDLVQHASVISAALSALAAVLSAVAAFRSFKLARAMHDEAKSDDRIILGRPSHPALRTREHAQVVIQIPIFNKSKRKAYIDEITVYDRRNQRVEVTWSDVIDDLGIPHRPADLVGVVDTATIFLRADVLKEFDYARILFAHSFSKVKEVVVFDPAAEFVLSNERNARTQRDA